jgi:hypothetical protein
MGSIWKQPRAVWKTEGLTISVLALSCRVDANREAKTGRDVNPPLCHKLDAFRSVRWGVAAPRPRPDLTAVPREPLESSQMVWTKAASEITG